MAWLTQPLFSSVPDQHLSLPPLSGADNVAWPDHYANGESWGTRWDCPPHSVNSQRSGRHSAVLKVRQCQWPDSRGDWHGAVVTWREEHFFRPVALKHAHSCLQVATICEQEAPWSRVSGGAVASQSNHN